MEWLLHVIETILLLVWIPALLRRLMAAEARRLSHGKADSTPAPAAQSCPPPLSDGAVACMVDALHFLTKFGLKEHTVKQVLMLRLPVPFTEWPAEVQSLLRECVAAGHFRGGEPARLLAGDYVLAQDEAIYFAELKADGQYVAFVDRAREL
jgi:hypothetical protein